MIDNMIDNNAKTPQGLEIYFRLEKVFHAPKQLKTVRELFREAEDPFST